jgi:hypothetical protein
MQSRGVNVFVITGNVKALLIGLNGLDRRYAGLPQLLTVIRLNSHHIKILLTGRPCIHRRASIRFPGRGEPCVVPAAQAVLIVFLYGDSGSRVCNLIKFGAILIYSPSVKLWDL